MALSAAVLAELNEEREALLKKRQAIDERLAAIDMLAPRKVTPTPRLVKRKTRRATPAATPQSEQWPTNGVVAELPDTLRPALRYVLSHPEGFKKPSEIIERLNRGGFAVSGKTPLAMRVYNELKRMLREDVLERDAEGRYALKGQ